MNCEQTNQGKPSGCGESGAVGIASRQVQLSALIVSGGYVQTADLPTPVTGIGFTTLWPPAGPAHGVGTRTFLENTINKGTVISIIQRGVLQTGGAAGGTQTLNIKVFLGTSELVLANCPVANATPANYWELELLITCRASGAAGQIVLDGRFSYLDAASPATCLKTKSLSTNGVTKAINTTIPQIFDTQAAWAVATTGNSIKSTFGAVTQLV